MSNACRADDVGADADMSVEDFLDNSCAAHASLPYDPVDMLDHMIKQGGIPAIGELARRRRTLVRARTSLLLQINAQGRFFARARMEMSGIAPSKKKDAKTGVRTALRPGPCDIAAANKVLPSLKSACGIIDVGIKDIERELRRDVRQLPVWKNWGQCVAGLGELSLAAIIGACGDPADYRGPAALWKRFGLGFITTGTGEQIRQRRTTDAALAIMMGYSPERRSVMHIIGECLIRAKGAHYERYCNTKASIAERYPELTKIHAHRRAMRKIEKRLLAELWIAARRARGQHAYDYGTQMPVPPEHLAACANIAVPIARC